MLKRYAGFALVIFFAFGAVTVHGVESSGNDAVVTVIQGAARVYAKEAKKGRLLKKGDLLMKDQEVKVAEKSRLEMRFPDGTVMRLSEKTHFTMNESFFNKQRESKNVKVHLSLGKLWAKVKKLSTPDSTVEVKTANAVAGVRGTVYRVNVEDDKSALVKVYDGTVYVANPPRDASKPGNTSLAPHQVSGPHEVPPPVHEVTMEEWHVIVKAMQQISITPQGVASQPQDIDLKADADDWVKWNQEMDKETLF